MSGIQGIIVCGEASESDEEEEFCLVQAQEHRANEAKRYSHSFPETRDVDEKGHPSPNQYQQKRVSLSLLHQKLWETNVSLEKNLSKALQDPLVKKTSHMATLISALPATQTATLTAHNALNNVNTNLTHLDVMLKGLSNVNTLETLRSQPSSAI